MEKNSNGIVMVQYSNSNSIVVVVDSDIIVMLIEVVKDKRKEEWNR